MACCQNVSTEKKEGLGGGAVCCVFCMCVVGFSHLIQGHRCIQAYYDAIYTVWIIQNWTGLILHTN